MGRAAAQRKESGNLERTDGIDEKGRRICEGWSSSRRVRFFANAIQQEVRRGRETREPTSRAPETGGWMGARKKQNKKQNALQVKMRIGARDLVPDELLYSNVVLRHEVDRVFLLADAPRARPALDRVGAFEDERARFAREGGREAEDVLEFCRCEVGHGWRWKV